MKKVSVLRPNLKPLPIKTANMKHCQGDHEKNKEICLTDSECMVQSQAQYIENLQQQIYVLENEISYLTYLQETNKQHPSMIAESEKMVKKLADSHNEIKNLKVELKRKQTTVDMIRSERDRVHRYKDELQEKFKKEKCRLLEDIITTRKDKESQQEKFIEIQQLFQDLKQNERNLQDDLDKLGVEMEQIKRERAHDKDIISSLLLEKEKLMKEIFELKMIDQTKPEKGAETIKALKENISELREQNEAYIRAVDLERLHRERLAEDNSKLIKRYAEIESDLAEVKAHLREEETRRCTLEQVHLSTVLEASEAKSREETLKNEIAELKNRLHEENERAHNLALQLVDERRFKSREEEKHTHVMQRLEQKEDLLKTRENENIELLRDNTYLKDQVLHLKEQVKNRDDEVTVLKQKVQEMQVSVEEFIQSTQAANRLAGERWKQLGQLAQGITALTAIAEPNS